MTARPKVALPMLLAALSAAAAACGARTSLVERTAPEILGGDPGGSGGGGGGGDGGSGGQGAQGGAGGEGAQGAGGQGGAVGGVVISASADSFLEAETHIATAADGRVASAWIAVSTNGEPYIAYAFSSDDGASWDPPLPEFSPGGRVGSDPVLAVDPSGRFYLTWVGFYYDQQGPIDMHVYVALAGPGETSFGPAIEVSDPAIFDNLYDKPWIALTDKGSAIITYSAQSSDSLSLIAARSVDGTSWTRSFIVDDPSFNTFSNLAFPCAPPSGDRVFASYLTFTFSGIDVNLSWSDDDGQTWSAAQKTQVSSEGDVAFTDVNCVAAGNEVWVSYGRTPDSPGGAETPKLSAIRIAHSTDGGASIAERWDAHDPSLGGYFMLPQIAREESGALDVVYYAGQYDTDPGASFRRARAEAPGTSFGPSTIVETPLTFLQNRSDPGWLGDYVGVAWRAGRLYTSYAVNTDGYSHVSYFGTSVP